MHLRYWFDDLPRAGEARLSHRELWLTTLVHVVDADIPVLMSIADIHRLGIYFDNLSHKLIHPESRSFAGVIRICGHPYLQWHEHIHTHFTFAELRRLHRRFGHPQVDKLANSLKRAKVS